MAKPGDMQHHSTLHHDPGALASLFSSTRLAPVWLLTRIYVGWVWLSAGWSMLQQAAWMNDGSALKDAWFVRQSGLGSEFTSRLVDWGAIEWIARVTAVGLTVSGIAVLLGLGTGLVAFLGATMSVNLVMTDGMLLGPEVFAFAMLLVLAWKTAGWIGLDRWVLPLLGAPWPGGFEQRAIARYADGPEAIEELR